MVEARRQKGRRRRVDCVFVRIECTIEPAEHAGRLDGRSLGRKYSGNDDDANRRRSDPITDSLCKIAGPISRAERTATEGVAVGRNARARAIQIAGQAFRHLSAAALIARHPGCRRANCPDKQQSLGICMLPRILSQVATVRIN